MMVYVFFVLGMRSKHRKNTYSFTNRRILEDYPSKMHIQEGTLTLNVAL